MNEALETAYVELSAYYPGIYDAFSKTLASMKELDEEAFAELLDLGQRAILNCRKRQEGYVAPMLANDLRQCAGAVGAFFSDGLETMGNPVRRFLIDMIKQSDEQLLRAKEQGVVVPNPPPRRFADVASFLASRSNSQSSLSNE